MDDRKKPAVAFWATVVVVVLIAYRLSIGPACWVSSRLGLGHTLVTAAYGPLIRISPRIVGELLERYSAFAAAENWGWRHLGRSRPDEPEVFVLGDTIFWGRGF
jgi:hypothetical protein